MTLQSNGRMASFIRIATLAAGALVLLPLTAAAQTVDLVAAPFTKTVTLPNGTSVGVPMWGFGPYLGGTCAAPLPGEAATVPGPRITVPPGSTSLTITLRNCLTADVSIMIPGQQASGSPVVVGGRVTSMAPLAQPGGAPTTYLFEGLKPGTFLYHSGTHPAVQVQMGLYGAVTTDSSAASAYPVVGYDQEVLLLFSEIDIGLHTAVANGTYGTTGPTSTIDYAPSVFLVNGESYRAGLAPISVAGPAPARTLVRMLNAGLRSHVAVIDNSSVLLVAEDGNPYLDARSQASVLLPAGKTHDAIWVPAVAGDYTVYDRTLHLSAVDQPAGGMLATLRVAGTIPNTSGPPFSIGAGADSYGASEDVPLVVSIATDGVLDNDPGAATAELYSAPGSGTLTLNANGTFSYVPRSNFFGVDSFFYQAVNGANRSAPTQVTITVLAVQDAPIALPLSLGLSARESKPVTVSAIDSDGDALTYSVQQLPTNGTLSIIVGTTRVPLALGASIPGGVLIYTPNPAAPYVGPDSFQFCAQDAASVCAAPSIAAVAFDVQPLATVAPTGTPLTLNVLGSDGASITAYRWTLEEDHTYEVVPGVLDPNTLSVSFHRSYMPVVQSGSSPGAPPLVDLTKRYFVSVLPTEGGYSNGGAQVTRTSTARVVVNKGPLPTAQIRVRVFEDNAPLNGGLSPSEPPLAGFMVKIDDAAGRYGVAGGHQLFDAFGNPIGSTYKACSAPPCEGYEVDTLGTGTLRTDAKGFVTFKNLLPGKYTVKVIPPSDGNWQQTNTIEGQKGVDAWVKANEPTFFTEFGPVGPHVEIGFVRPTRDTSVLTATGGNTISGDVTMMHMSRPPDFRMFSGGPYDWTRPWIGLNVGLNGGLIYAQPTDEDGHFEITGVPSGTYSLVVWDSALQLIIATKSLTVETADLALGDVPVFPWFHRLYHYVFEDLNKNGQRDPGEAGIGEQAVNTRWRDGSVYQASATDGSGFVPFEETFPFFAYQVAEVDYARFRATGVTVVVDAGGDTRANTLWPQQVGIADTDSRILAPQPQTEGTSTSRTETGPVLTQGFQGFIGQTNLFLWGKAPYDLPNPLSPCTPGNLEGCPDIDVAPLGDFPGLGDTDADGNGVFDVDRFNGGISGIVHYTITRAESNARWNTAEEWEPGIPRVRLQLWDETRTRLLNEATSDSWDDSLPTGCQLDASGVPFTYLGNATDCYDGLRNFNQVRPAVFDGGYAFFTMLQGPAGQEYSLPLDQRTIEKPLPAGKYVVKVIVPDGYRLVKEEDKNVDFGDEYIPAEFLLPGYPLGGGAAGDAAPKESFQDPLYAPFCVGTLHTVPDELLLYPGVPSSYAGDQMPLCDEKAVTLRDGQNGAANFFLFTEAPIAGHIIGFVLDDTANEFDPNSPQFGEKYAPPWLPISIRDWTGREIVHTYTDRYGVYNAMVPSTYTANAPAPSGMSPSMLTACINSTVMAGPDGTMVPEPFYDKRYTQFCYTLQYMPGTTTYLDTPVLPNSAFTGPGTSMLDAELPNQTPVIYSVNGPDNVGPYLRNGAGAAARVITITSAGTVQVPNPAYDGVTNSIPKTIARDFGFGTVAGQVLLGGVPLAVVGPWSDTSIQAQVLAGQQTAQLTVVRGGVVSPVGVTLTVGPNALPATVSPGQSIQAAIDAAAPGDLILVRPGTYEENVIMHKPVRLQGAGARSTIINAVKVPSEKQQVWRDRVSQLFTASPDYMLPTQATTFAAGGDQTGELLGPMLGGEGAGVTVLGRRIGGDAFACPATARPTSGGANSLFQAFGLQTSGAQLIPRARIDGFGITGSDQAAGIEVNAHACNLQLSNNRIFSNFGDFAGGIKLGHPGELAPLSDEQTFNEGVTIAFNHVSQNGTAADSAGGAIAIGSGSTSYSVNNNFVVGNFTLGFGAGISHMGLSNGARINQNVVVFNESFNQMFTTSGGGIFIGGRPPLAGGLSPGAGNVIVSNNLIQGNAASGGDGGGIALLNVNGQDAGQSLATEDNPDEGPDPPTGGPFCNPALVTGANACYRVDLFGNTIVNNVAGLAGAGIAIQDALNVRIIHNTIARNDSLAVAGAAFTPQPNTDPFVSTPQPSGIASRGHSPQLLVAIGTGQPNYSRPQIANSIIWQNRSFSYGPVTGGVQNPGQVGPTYGLIPRVVSPFWDLGILGGTGPSFAPTYSVFTSLAGLGGSNNVATTPLFLRSYLNGDRKQTIVTPELTTGIQTPAAFDEGGNFIRPMFGPLALTQVTSGARYGDYHVSGGLSGQALFNAQFVGDPPALFTLLGDVPQTLAFDADGTSRTGGTFPHRGSDQATVTGGTAPVVPTISVADTSVTEGNTGTVNMTFTVTLSAATTATVTVDYLTADGTALDFEDYVGAAGTLTFAPGTTVQTATIAIKGDLAVEPNETLLLSLGFAVNGTIADGLATGTIVNNDIAGLSVSDASVTEGNAGQSQLVFTVTQSPTVAQVVTVNFTTANGTATLANNDYVANSGTLTFPANTATQTVTVLVNGDIVNEANETVFLNLSGVVNSTILDAQGVGTIVNDDGPVVPPALSVNDVAVTEGNAGIANLAFAVTLSASPTANVTVNYATAPGTTNPATAGTDYTTTSGSLTFLAGTVTLTQIVNVPVIGDATVEQNETLFLNLSVPVNATIADAQGIGTILSDESFSDGLSAEIATISTVGPNTMLLAFAGSDGPTGGAQTLTISSPGVAWTLLRRQNLSSPGQLGTSEIWRATPAATLTNLAVTSTPSVAGYQQSLTVIAFPGATGTGAVNGASAPSGAPSVSLITTQPGSLVYGVGNDWDNDVARTVPANQTMAHQYLATTVGDTFWVQYLTSPVANAGTVATLNDTAPTVDRFNYAAVEVLFGAAVPSLSVSDVAVTEGDAGTTNMVFAVTLSASPAAQVTVNYATAPGTTNPATAGADYTTTTGTLTFAAGATAAALTQTVTVPVVGETLFETNETVFLNLTAPVNATLADGQGLGTINNDDVAPPGSVNISVADATVTEGNVGTVNMGFAVTISGTPVADVTVNYATAPGTTNPATSVTDYTTTSGTLTFLAGATGAALTQTVNVPIVGDTTVELNETLFLNLSAPSANGTIVDGQGLGTITDDDAPVGLVAAFGFEETTGTAAVDTAGGDNNGEITGAASSLAGRFGRALSFNGTSNWVTVADAANLDVTTGMTLSAWVRPTSLAGDWRTVALKETATGLAYALYGADNANQPPAGYANIGGVDRLARAAALLPLNTWSHITVTYGGAPSALRFYVNGVLVATSNQAGSIANGSGPLRIGGNGVWGEYFGGLIDEVRVYNRALSAAEIVVDMNAPVVPGAPNQP